MTPVEVRELTLDEYEGMARYMKRALRAQRQAATKRR